LRSGYFIKQPGYEAFIPAPLPPDPPLDMRKDLLQALSEADSAIGRLQGASAAPATPQLFGRVFLLQEAVFSSRIEGAEAALTDLLEFELGGVKRTSASGLAPALETARALRYGLERVEETDVNLRFIRDVHGKLLEGARGGRSWPGEFRKSQNWVGAQGSTIRTAAFVPPPVHEMHHALDHLERFLRNRESFPLLVRCALVHAQFETIHPFLEGNGRLGRMLVPLMLRRENALDSTPPCLSRYLCENRAEYFDRLNAIRRDGKWEEWVTFFLRGMREAAREAADIIIAALAMRENHRAAITAQRKRVALTLELLDYLYTEPITHIGRVSQLLNCVYVTAAKIVGELTELGILIETTGRRRNRRFRYQPYLALFAGV